jgi:hypothetical protein
MGRLSDLATLTDSREDIIIRLAEMAGALRSARAADVAVPVLCLLDCEPHHWTAWGAADICTNCGTRPLPAAAWHRLLTAALFWGSERSHTTGKRRAA